MKGTWDSLIKESASVYSSVIKRLVYPHLPTNVFIGVDAVQKRRMLLVELPLQQIKKYEPILSCHGFDSEIKSFGAEPQHSVTLTLKEKDIQDDKLFYVFVDDICERMNQAHDISRLAACLFNGLESWQKFFEREKLDGLTASEQIGLYGELWFLRHFVLNCEITSQALDCWKGPQKREHDFQFPGLAVEVKAGKQRQFQKVNISSENQLDHGVYDLLLFHLALHPNDSAGQTLPELVGEIRNLLVGREELLHDFREKLSSVWYFDQQADQYSLMYTVRDYHFYWVKDGFPRLTRNNIPSGIGEVKYSINLTECKDYLIEVDKVTAWISTILGGKHHE